MLNMRKIVCAAPKAEFKLVSSQYSLPSKIENSLSRPIAAAVGPQGSNRISPTSAMLCTILSERLSCLLQEMKFLPCGYAILNW